MAELTNTLVSWESIQLILCVLKTLLSKSYPTIFLIWLGRQDYKIRPVFYPSGHQQKTLMLKIVPDDFVEPITVRFLPT